jgi:hypothetical protein
MRILWKPGVAQKSLHMISFERYVAGEYESAWKDACQHGLTSQAPVASAELQSMATYAVQQFVDAMIQAKSLLKSVGYQFFNEPNVLRTWDENAGPVLSADTLHLVEQLPLIARAWFHRIRTVDFRQQTSQMFDTTSPLRGLGLFALGLSFDADDLNVTGLADGVVQGNLQLTADGHAVIDIFKRDDGPLFCPIPNSRLDGFVDDEGEEVLFIDLMRREARHAGLSDYERVLKGTGPYIPEKQLFDGILPQAVSF